MTSIENGNVTGEIGELSGPQGMRHEKPEGEPSKGERPDGEPPKGERPKGRPEGDEKPDGEAPEAGERGEDPSKADFVSSGESIDFTISEESVISVGIPKDDKEGTIEDISEGSILEVALDDDQHASSIIIRKK